MTSAYAILAGFMIFFLLLFLVIYIYSSLTLMFIAKKLNMPNVWMAWIPFLNFYLLLKMAKMSPYFLLLFIGAFIPYIGFIFSIANILVTIVILYKICEARKRPGWWALLTLIPFFGVIWYFILMGILAWGK